MSSRYNKDKKFSYIKKSPFNTRKKTMIVDPDEGIVDIKEYGKGKNFPGKIIRTLNSTGGLIKGIPKLTKKGWK